MGLPVSLRISGPASTRQRHLWGVLAPARRTGTLAHRPPEWRAGGVALPVPAALALVLGVVAAGLIALLVAALWWADHRRTMRLVLWFAVQSLTGALEELLALLPAEAEAAQQAGRCRDLCAAVLRLAASEAGGDRRGRSASATCCTCARGYGPSAPAARIAV